MTELFFLFGAIGLACLGVWFLSPQVEMTDEEKGLMDIRAFNEELRRRSATHGERIAARRKYNC